MSHHVGELENYATMRAFTGGIAHFRRLFDIEPQVVAHDLHPEYLSTKFAMEMEGVECIGVQHHHAPIAACLADNRADGPAIGVAFDGLGYGLDSTMWGGELLIAELCSFQRVGHFSGIAMPGGTGAIREPWRMAAAYLDAIYGDRIPDNLGVVRRNAKRWRSIVMMARRGINSPITSSVGRLFDAVAAILGIRDFITYEGQAAIELEQHADQSETATYEIATTSDETVLLRGEDLLDAVVDDVCWRTTVPIIAARFHNTLAQMIVAACETMRSRFGIREVALSGGVFQNFLLLERAVKGLERAGFHVMTHQFVPTNDGGISLGQAAIAAARDRMR